MKVERPGICDEGRCAPPAVQAIIVSTTDLGNVGEASSDAFTVRLAIEPIAATMVTNSSEEGDRSELHGLPAVSG